MKEFVNVTPYFIMQTTATLVLLPDTVEKEENHL